MNAINEWLFNANNIDMVLRELMERGTRLCNDIFGVGLNR